MFLYLPAGGLGKSSLTLLDKFFHLWISNEPNVRWGVLYFTSQDPDYDPKPEKVTWGFIPVLTILLTSSIWTLPR